jgi:hypothetical protein
MTITQEDINFAQNIHKELKNNYIGLTIKENDGLGFKFIGNTEKQKKIAKQKMKELKPKINKNKSRLIKVSKELKFKNNLKKIRQKNKFDPRKDLEDDSELWKKFLKFAYEKDKEVYNIMHGFRCKGTRLKKDKIIKIDKDRTLKEDNNYKNENEWKRDLLEFLKPIKDDLKKLLKELNQDQKQTVKT